MPAFYTNVTRPTLPTWDTAKYPYYLVIFNYTVRENDWYQCQVRYAASPFEYTNGKITNPEAQTGYQVYSKSGGSWNDGGMSDAKLAMQPGLQEGEDVFLRIWTSHAITGYMAAGGITPGAWLYHPQSFWTGVAMGLAGKALPSFKQEGEPLAYLYNGVQLPVLPVVELPYLYILRDSSGGYYLKCLETTITALSGGAFPPVSTGIAFYASDDKWVSKTTTGLNFTIVWSNTDVYYSEAYEDIGGTLCLAASEPVPVYE